MLAVSDGAAMITENIFDGRFMFVNELARLGADIRTDGHHALVRGRERLSGAPVRATDIRAGAGLVIAGLCADGVTRSATSSTSTAATPDCRATWPGWARRSYREAATTVPAGLSRPADRSVRPGQSSRDQHARARASVRRRRPAGRPPARRA